MEYQYPLTIITPTYNRKNTINTLYESLKNQTNKNFQWLVIDDGSDDGTKEYFNKLAEEEQSFVIEYYCKANGGKHTALNFSHCYIKGEMVCIVDSDDYLVKDAVEKMMNYWQKYRDAKNICGLTFLKGYSQEESLIKNYVDKDIEISNHIDFRINGQRKEDRCEVIRSDLFKKYKFPEFENERFIGESYLWNLIGFDYDTVYINQIIYVCEYLEGGLSKLGRKLRISCPNGGMEDCKTYFIKKRGRKVKLKILIKEAWLFICYGKFAGLKFKQIVKKSGRKKLVVFNYLFGYLLYKYWKHKFCKN